VTEKNQKRLISSARLLCCLQLVEARSETKNQILVASLVLLIVIVLVRGMYMYYIYVCSSY